ncbi:EamA family transporter [Candidatus Peregrinibacteria bacterium]|nr:EamA family transporter [Candidatus Peregrinibacteria bacterium]
MKVYFLLALCVIFPIISQITMKKGMNMVGQFNSGNIFDIGFLLKTFSNPYVLGGIALYAINSVLWLMVISKLPISKAYPAISLSYVIIIIGAYFFIGEPLTMKKIIGSLAILGGVSIIFMK